MELHAAPARDRAGLDRAARRHRPRGPRLAPHTRPRRPSAVRGLAHRPAREARDRDGGARRRRGAVGVALRGAAAAPLRPGELVVSFLDVGQGDATLIQLGATAVLVDTGPPDGPILKRLEQAHVKRLDALFLTHAEADHEGAAPAVIREYAPRLVVDGGAGWNSPVQRALPTALAARRTRAVTPAAGQTIEVGGLRFAILWPRAGRPPRGATRTITRSSPASPTAISRCCSRPTPRATSRCR